MDVPGGAGAGATQKPSQQNEASRLQEQDCTEPPPPGEPSGLDITCAMEFLEEFVELLAQPLRTLPSIGPPAALAYRPEVLRGCLRAEKFCCQRNRDLYEFILNERKKHESARDSSISIESHKPHGSDAERHQEKERAYQRQQERQLARQLALLAAEPTPAVAESTSQLGTISYMLSQEPPSPTGWTLMPAKKAAEPEEEEPISYSITCCDFTVMGSRVAKNELLEKYYRHGGKFLTMLPDGTAQIFYPSGNLAVIVVREKKRFVCIVQEDKASNSEIQAVFASNGRSTCYHPHGTVWITMNTAGGQCLDRAGNRVRRWMWPSSTASSGPCAPLSPIFLSLNLHVGVRIVGQDKITVSFLAMGQQAKFNVGTKVQGSQAGQLRVHPQLNEDELLLLALRVKILRLIDKLRGCLNFPSNEQWDKMKPPAYLVTQTLKILYLCKNSDIREELCSSVRAIVKTPV
ncbi:glutamate-rich protein 6 isoform X2 [Coturnix japonica]|uniref:glutamate-rich protein 6 isoform X2 n=1 Tax=Coturnix japonica TaxID=93934 RepID=UPI000777A62D|nr:glutamate-rich protein 6 isoform X2 [Coturnix japonica]